MSLADLNPVPVLRDSSSPRARIPLNGTWRISAGALEQPPPFYHHTIEVPSVVDCAEPPLTGRESSYYWYARELDLLRLPEDVQLWLRLEQVQFGTSVRIDDRSVGGSSACTTSQEYRLDTFVRDGRHQLQVRVGHRSTLPPESAAGRDQEKEVFTPGIWGDVSLLVTGPAHIRDVLMLPDLAHANAQACVWVADTGLDPSACHVRVNVSNAQGDPASISTNAAFVRREDGALRYEARLPIDSPRAWSPEDPYLYVSNVSVSVAGTLADAVDVRFGMRDIRIVGSSFHLNGHPLHLRGGNIAFHRFLSDPERRRLPWTMEWVRKAFIEIPRDHHFNFFRFHLGRAYHQWYDLADEHGLLLQDEWAFWNATGSNAEIEQEFRQWIKDNGNHPSIIIWDPLNESTDDSLIHDVVPSLRGLDPTRPWEAVDFVEQHPYIYSLGMTLNHRPFGFTKALTELERSGVPVVVNEFLWWWFDASWRPTVLMQDVVERWLGRTCSTADIVRHQAYLAEELVGLFRRMRCAAIQPFVYLSNNEGPTAHWFEGPIGALKPKPVLAALKNAFAPFGLSIDYADRHGETGASVLLKVHVLNDTTHVRHGDVVPMVSSADGGEEQLDPIPVRVPPGGHALVDVRVELPMTPGPATVRCDLFDGTRQVAASSREIHVFDRSQLRRWTQEAPVVLDPGGEVPDLLRRHGWAYHPWAQSPWPDGALMYVGSFGLAHQAYREQIDSVGSRVNEGATLIVQEPEFRVVGPAEFEVVPGLVLRAERRHDVDKGGYDSYVFPEDPAHPLWRGLRPEHFRWFNGGVGGEIVSEYTVEPSLPSRPLASCGLGLHTAAVCEISFGRGRVIVSRIQVRGRLNRNAATSDPFARRYDPVAAQYLLNLLSL